jgi:selenocysteine lyase/cysteine desulfurase
MLSRRRFLFTGSLGVAGAALAAPKPVTTSEETAADLHDWSAVRRQFDLSPDYAHLGLFFLTSHPRPVREAVEAYRRKLDANPFMTVESSLFEEPAKNLALRSMNVIAQTIGAQPNEIALTQNTTTGLSLIYHGLPLEEGDEIVTTNQDHFVHHEAIRLSTERNGATWRKIALFDSFDTISADDIVDRIRKAIGPKTRVVGVTWVHSSSGLKMPIRAIADMIADVNRSRSNRVLLVVDGVHGFGVEDPRITQLGADAFSAGLHKWIFAPRGTGFVWAKPDVWASMKPLIPSFTSFDLFRAWSEEHPPTTTPDATWFSPGGFQAYEHYWGVPAAFEFHRAIGELRISDRIHALNGQLNEELRKIANVNVHTPRARELNAGMVVFEVKGRKTKETVAKLLAKRIIGSATPYAVSYARLACGIMNTHEEVERAVAAVRALSS